MPEKIKIRPRDEATEKIECYIVENQLQPHDKLPSERHLSELWGFNRMTLRSAITRLVEQGKLYTKLGSGTYVAVPKIKRNLQDLKSLSQVLKEENRELATKTVSREIIESNKQISKSLLVPLGHKVLELTRVRYFDGTPSIIETSYVNISRYPGIEESDFEKKSLYQVLEHDYKVNISHGSEKISVTYATQEEATLLKIKENQAVFFLRGTVVDVNNQPVEYFKSIVRSDMVRFSSILKKEGV